MKTEPNIKKLNPLQSLQINTLIPPGVDVGIHINFTDATRFFVSKQTTHIPKLHIKEVRLQAMACLLEPDSLLRVHQHLAAGRLRMPYLADVTKSFSVEQGHLTANLDISLKDAYER